MNRMGIRVYVIDGGILFDCTRINLAQWRCGRCGRDVIHANDQSCQVCRRQIIGWPIKFYRMG